MAVGWQGIHEHEGKQVFACPEPNCYYRILMRGPDDSTDHRCPFIGDKKVGWSVTKTLVEQVWEMLDQSIDIIKKDPPDQLNGEYSKHQARAYCNVLAIFMKPIFQSSDEIAREGLKRWQMRQSGEDYETPGLGHLRYAGLEDSKPRAKSGPPATPSLSEAERTAIVNGFNSGMFTEQELAAAFKVTVDQIKQVVST